jgi:hypothetical protein
MSVGNYIEHNGEPSYFGKGWEHPKRKPGSQDEMCLLESHLGCYNRVIRGLGRDVARAVSRRVRTRFKL